MIAFPPGKINLGLHVVARRTDGYHDLETTFIPIDWCDAIEVVAHPRDVPFELVCTGDPIPDGGQNLIEKAWKKLSAIRSVPPVLVHLLKKIPTGAGLGGGSSDAAHFLRLMNEQFMLKLSDTELKTLASELGSDCAFFLHDGPMFARGRGDVLERIKLPIDDFFLLVVFTGIHSSTAEAYRHVRPSAPENSITELLKLDAGRWKNKLTNDFEQGIFGLYPLLGKIKEELYDRGAVYASMSGSGSAIFGLFGEKPDVSFPPEYRVHVQPPAGKIL